MPGNSQSVCVGPFDRRLQFRARDMAVDLDRSDTFVRPVVHGPSRIFWSGQGVDLDLAQTLSFEIGSSYVDLWTDDVPLVDRSLDLQVGVRLVGSCRTDRGDPSRQIQAWVTEGHIVNQKAAVRLAHEVKKVIMHPHQPGNGGVPGKVDAPHAGWRLGRSRAVYGHDLSAGNQDGLVRR